MPRCWLRDMLNWQACRRYASLTRRLRAFHCRHDAADAAAADSCLFAAINP